MRNIFLFLTVFFVFLSVRVAAQPCDPDFSFTVSCNVVTFTPKQTGAGISYKWKFGTVAKDSLVTTQSPVTFTYYVDNTGMQTFDVTLTVKGPNCIEKSMTKQVKITVPSLPVPKLTTPDLTKPFTRCNASVIAYTLKVSNATTTTASNTKYTINWGDGSAVETINVPPGFTTTTHSYSKLGLFPIVETITDLNGCVDSANYRFFNGNDPATAAPSTPANSNKCVTSVVTFPFNKQAKGNDPSTIYICKVDDGSQPVTLLHDTLNFFFIHTFTKGSCDPEFVGKLQQEGIFTITVDAVNACSSQPSSTGIKLSSPGQAKFSVKPKTEDCVGKVFDIVNESDKGHYFDNGCKDDMVAYWSISPNTNYTITAGSLGTYPNTPGSPDGFSVSFSQPGTYEIKLVWDARFSSGCPPVETKRTICVLPKPTSSFTISPSGTKCIPNSNTVTFTNTSNTLKYCGTAKYTWKPIFDSSPCGSTGGFTYLNGKNANSQDIDVRFDKSGTYKIRLKVENICGIDSSEQTITIAEGAKSVIDSIPNFCDGAKITPRLKSTSSACGAAATGWVWSFPGGDPMNYTGETPPEIMYNTPGTYTISVATTNGCGTTTATRTFTVYKSPTIPPNITVIVSPPCKGKTITFSNPSPGNLEYKWSGPNGFMSTKPQPDPIPAVPPGGIYSLTVTDPVSKCTKTQTYNVTVNDLPPVTLTASQVCEKQATTLKVKEMTYNDYKWAPSGQLVQPTDKKSEVTTTVFQNTSPVTYTVTVTDGNGCSNTASVTVTPDPLPKLTFPTPAFLCANMPVTLVATGTPTGGTKRWSSKPAGVIDPNSGALNAPAGLYTITFHYKSPAGCEDSLTRDLCVQDVPVADFTYTLDKTTGCFPLTLTPKNASNTKDDCKEATYSWAVKFNGDACDLASVGQVNPASSNLKDPAPFVFQKPGVYVLTLTVSNDCGTNTKTAQITVAGPPAFELDPISDQCKVIPENSIMPKIKDLSLKTCDSPILPNGGYDWQFTTGGGTPSNSNQQVPGIVKYTTIGAKTVTLKVSNGCGSATKQVTFNIVDLPKVSLAYNNTPQPPCVGSPLNITATPIPAGGTFKWQGPGGSLPNTTATLSIPSAQVSNAGTYTVTYTIGGAVPCTATATVTVTVNPLPAVTVAVNPTVAAYCAGGSAMLTASGADTYAWTPATTPPTGSSVTVNPSTSTTYTVTGTATSTGCKNTATATVTVHPIPTVTVPPNLTLCPNISTPLGGSGTPAGAGIWTGPNVTNGTFNGPPGTYTATYTYTTSTNPPCTATATTNICVVNVPKADFTIDKDFGCGSLTVKTTNKSNTLTLPDCKSATYNWTVKFNGAECEPGSSGQVSPSSSTDQDPVFIFSKQGKYDLTLTVSNICGTSTKTVSVTVGGPPQLICASVNNQCKQAMNIITPTVASKSCNGGPMSYQWSFPTADSPLNSPQEVPGAVKYLTEGLHTYTVTVTNTCGPSTCSQSFTIQPLPTPTVSANKPCVGDKLDLTIGGLAPGSGYSYKWDGPAGFTSAVANPSRNPAQQIHSGTYTVTVTLAGCTATASVTVTVNPLPVPSIIPPGSICLGQSATLKAQPDLMKDYSWGPPTDLNLTTGQTVISKPLAIPVPPRTYTVTVTDDNKCTNTASVTLTVNPLPVVKIVQPPVLCNQNIGEPLTFSPKTGGMGTWKGQHIDQMGVFTPTGLPGGTGDFPVTYIFKDSNGCTDSATVVVKVNDPVDLIMPKDTGVCINSGKFILKASHAPGTWSGAPANILNPATGEFTPSTDDVYTLTYTYGSKTCERKGTVKVTVWKRPVAKIDPVSAICLGQSATLKAQPDLMKAYAWGPPTDLNLTTGQTVISKPLAIPTPPRAYTVTVTDGNMCTNTASVTLTVNPLPMVKIEQPQVLCNQSIGEPLIFSPKTGGMGTWKGQHIDQMGVFTPTGLPGGTGDFPVTYIFKDSNGCTDSATVVVKVQDPVVLKISNDTAVCINTGKFILKANYSPGTWSGAPPNILNPLTGEFTPLLDGVYTLTYSYGTGTCKREATMKVTVWKLPTIAVTAAKPEICIGDATTLTATGAQDYFWSPATGLSPTTGSMVQANPTATQTYTIVGTDANKCNNSTTFKLTVNQLPVVKAPRDTVFCNQPITEDLSKFPGLIPLTGGTWAIVSGPGSITTDGKFTPNGIGMVTVVRTYKDTKNCEKTDTMLINIIEPATIKMPNDTFVCIKSPILGLQAMPPGLIGKWTSVPAKVTPDGKFDPDMEGTYTLTFTVAGGDKTCERKGTMVIIVNPLPKPQIAGDNKICLKDSTTLMVTDLSSTLTTYAWGPPDSGLSDYDKSTVKASPTQNTTYTVTVTNSNGCTNTATFSLTIDPLPTVTADPKTLCNQKIGEQIIGSPTTGGTGEWTGANIDKNGIFTPTGTPAGLGDFPVIYTFTDLNGCKNSASTVIKVDTPQVLELPADRAVCLNSGVISLTAKPAPGSWSQLWTGNTPTLTADGQFTPSKVGTYQLVYSYGEKTCLRKDTMTIIVHPLPKVEVKGDNVLCFGDTTTLTASGAATYAWSPNDRISSTTGAVVQVWPTDMTIAYTVVGMDTNQCENSASINILVNKLPIVVAPDDITVCNQPIEENLNLLPKLMPPTGGKWTGTGQGSVTQDGKFTPNGLGKFTAVYTFTDGNGCVNRDTMRIETVAPADIMLPKDITVCIHPGVLDLAPETTPTGGGWTCSPNPALVTPDGKFSTNKDGDYVLTYTYGKGTCLRTATMKIKVNPLPVPITAGDMKICKNDSTTISVTPGNLDVYDWSPSKGLSATDKAVIKASPDSSTVYTVKVTDANGCENTATFSLAIDPLPMASAGPAVTVCNQPIGEPLFGSPTTGGTGEWSGQHISTAGIFTPNGLGIFPVCYTFTDLNGCVDSACTIVTVKEPDTLKLPKDIAVCINSGVVDLAPETTPTGGGWTCSPDSSLVTPDGKFSTNKDGDYVLTYTYGKGTCLRTETMKIKVNPLPVPITAGDMKICKNDSTTISVTPGNLDVYAWSPAKGLSATDKAVIKASPDSSTVYTLKVTDVNGCVNTATFSLTIDSLPIASTSPVTLCNQPIGQQLIGNPKANGTGTWSGPNTSPSGIFTPTGTPAGLGNFTVCYTFTDQNGCMDDSCTLVTVEEPKTLVLPKDTAVCINSKVLDLAIGTTPPGGDWTCSPNPSLVTPDGKFTPSKADDYVLTYTFGKGTCLRTETMKIKVNPLPTPTVASQTICFRDTVTLNVAPSNYVSYLWSPALYLSAVDTATVVCIPTVKDVAAYTLPYSVAVTDINGCINTTTASVTVNPLPTVEAGDSTTYCDNPKPMDIQLNLSKVTPPGGIWSGDGIVDATKGLFRTDVAGGPGRYKLLYTYTINVTGCTDLDSVFIRVVPPIQAVVPPFDTTCYTSGLTTLTSFPATGGTWSGPGIIDPKGVFDPKEAAKVTSTPPQTTYELVYSYGKDDCETKDTLKMLVVNYIGVVDAGADFAVCDSTPAFNLVGKPAGGTWTPGISNSVNGTFDAAYVKPGVHTLVYTYKDPIAGCAWTDTVIATVHPLPGANFKKIEEGCITKPIQFENTTANAEEYYWTFGDGGFSKEKNPQHAYTQIGTYTITLKAKTDKGCQDSVKQTIIVAEPPYAAFTPSTNEGCAELCVGFTNQSTGYKITYFWDFGNGLTSALEIPDTVCFQQGMHDTTYYVQLNVKNLCGTRYEVEPILVHPKPVMQFGVNVDQGCSPLLVEFANISYGDPDSLIWEFDGIISHDQIPAPHLFSTDPPDSTDKIYTIRLIGINDCGRDTFTKSITVLPNHLNAFFNTDPPVGCQPLKVKFTNYSTGLNMVYNWTFGDKTPDSVEKDPLHTFDTPGEFNVVLKVGNGCGYVVDSSKVKVYPQPTPILEVPKKFCEDSLVQFKNKSVGTLGSLWDFGDGSTSALKDPLHAFQKPGKYMVKLTVYADTTGCPATDSSLIEIAERPVAAFSHIPDACVPASVQMTNQSTGADYYAWTFGNGDVSSVPDPTVAYKKDGTFQICLVAYDNEDCHSDPVCSPIIIHPKPKSIFGITNADPCGLPLEVQLNNLSQGATGYKWNFGVDPLVVSSVQTSPSAVYSDSGLYKITLIAENQFKCRDTSAQSIRALYDPVADFEWLPKDGCQPLAVNFDTIRHFFNQVWWEFGDGSKSTEFSPTHIYKDTGYYSVKLRVGSYGICFDDTIGNKIVRVYPTPTAKFTYSEPLNPAPPDGTVFFKNESSADATLFKWAFGDGDSSVLKDPTHRYFHNWVDNMTLEKDLATLWAENVYGCLDSFTLPVMHIPIKGLFVPNAFSPETGVAAVREFLPAGVGLKKYKIEVFSSWGELLWVSEELTPDGRPAEAWDGMYKGKLMPQDVYVWKVEAEFENGENWRGMENTRKKLRRTGTVTLLR